MLDIENMQYEDQFYKNLGLKLKSFRTKANLSQKQVATKLGVTFQQYQKYEAGINRIPLSRLVKICTIYKTDLLSDYCNKPFSKKGNSKLTASKIV